MTEQWVLLWSKRQNCFHVETVEGWLSKNRVAYRDNATLNDYHPIYIGDKETCHATADSVRSTVIARDQVRAEKAPS